MLPTQINAVYHYLADNTDNPKEFARQLKAAGKEFNAVEAVLYLPMCSWA